MARFSWYNPKAALNFNSEITNKTIIPSAYID
jgi:hypothetical protein